MRIYRIKMQKITNVLSLDMMVLMSILLMVFLVSGCKNQRDVALLNDTKSENSNNGTLTVCVTLGPVSPVERNDSSHSSIPGGGVRFVVFTTIGAVIPSVITDKQGNCSVNLPPGTYRVEMQPTPLGRTKDLPAEVIVIKDQETKLSVRLDTGMR